MSCSPRVQTARLLLGWLLAWLLLTLLMVAASSGDSLRRDQPIEVLRSLQSLAAMNLPYLLFSWGLALHAQAHTEDWTQLRALLRIYSLSLLALMLPFPFYATFVFMWVKQQPLADFWPELQKTRWLYLIYDAALASCVFFAQLVLVSRRLAAGRELAWRLEQADNLRLRLHLLQGQLEPHFLFNTLNGVSALVRAGDRSSALSALSRISELLRYALRASRQSWVSVADELAFIRDYMALQQLRFGEGLQMQWELADEDWQSWASPPLLLQPLVENAVRHGMEAQAGQGRLLLGLQRQEAHWCLRLENPLPPPDLVLSGHGMGLSNTSERLRMLFGDAAQLEANREADRFVLTLRVPLRGLDEFALERPDR